MPTIAYLALAWPLVALVCALLFGAVVTRADAHARAEAAEDEIRRMAESVVVAAERELAAAGGGSSPA